MVPAQDSQESPNQPVRDTAGSRSGRVPSRELAENYNDPGLDGNETGQAKGHAPQKRQPGERWDAESTPAVVDEVARDDHPQSSLRRHPAAVAVGLILLASCAAGGYVYWDYARHFETTDDAFIDSRQFGVAPKVSGYVTAVLVTDNQHVRAGEVIARIDDRDYRNAADQAEAEVAAAKATIQNIDAQIEARQAETDEAAAQEKQAQAALEFAEAEARRYQFLALRGSGTVQRAQQANSDLKQRQADLARAKAALAAAERQIAALHAQRAGAAASLARAKAQAAQAKLNLEYTAVTAAQAGRAVRLTAAAGQYAQTGQSLTMFVPDTIWVTANYKETQVDRMRPGNPVSISIDAYPKRKVHGHVDSIQPGSGTAFSLLPAENATGNYVKVVQRVPVKIAMEDAPADVALGPGMSAVPVARVRPDRSLFERITGQR